MKTIDKIKRFLEHVFFHTWVETSHEEAWTAYDCDGCHRHKTINIMYCKSTYSGSYEKKERKNKV